MVWNPIRNCLADEVCVLYTYALCMELIWAVLHIWSGNTNYNADVTQGTSRYHLKHQPDGIMAALQPLCHIHIQV